jgi:hypothetical protein
MDNQHRQIKGYNELTQEDIDLMNRVKIGLAAEIQNYLDQVKQRNTELRVRAETALRRPVEHNMVTMDTSHDAANATLAKLAAAEPERWLAMARTDFQTALMKLVRAIAQPTFL